jgi:hypothetical protein
MQNYRIIGDSVGRMEGKLITNKLQHTRLRAKGEREDH